MSLCTDKCLNSSCSNGGGNVNLKLILTIPTHTNRSHYYNSTLPIHGPIRLLIIFHYFNPPIAVSYKQDFNCYVCCKNTNCIWVALLKMELYRGSETASVCRWISKSHKTCDAHTTSDVYCNRHIGTALSAVVKTVFIHATPTAHLTLRYIL